MKYSIIVPVYNAENYLAECLESLCAQREKDMEIILVNDGSTDGSLEICKAYEYKDSRILLVDQKNEGVSAARNRALSLATGEWLLFVDSDDKIREDTIDTIEKAKNPSCDFIVFADLPDRAEEEQALKIVKVDNPEEILLQTVGIKQKVRFFDIPLASVWGKIYRRDFLVNHAISFDRDLVMGEDLFFNLYVQSFAQNIGIYMEGFYYYRYNISSASKGKNERVLQRDSLFQEKLYFFAKENKFEALLSQGCTYSTLGGILVCLNSYFSRMSLFQYKKEFKLFLSQKPYKEALLMFHEVKHNFTPSQRIQLKLIELKFFILLYTYKKIMLILQKCKFLVGD